MPLCVSLRYFRAHASFYLNEDGVNTDNVREGREKESIVGQMSREEKRDRERERGVN